jgi:FkbM family methyltransferase
MIYTNIHMDKNSNLFKNLLKKVIIKIVTNIKFLDSAVKYSKGIGYQASLKSEVQFLINSNTSTNTFILFDIGANIGNYSLLVAELFPKSTVYSFEPSKATFDQLVQNVKSQLHIIPIQIAFGEDSKQANLYSNQVGSGMASLYNRELNNSGIKFNQTEIIKVEKLDDWVAINKINPDYIKIDVEGSELSVLKGGTSTLRKVRAVQFEFGGTAIDAKTYFKDYYNFFTQLNFSLYRYTPSGLLKIEAYSEKEELFEYMNYLAIPKTMDINFFK